MRLSGGGFVKEGIDEQNNHVEPYAKVSSAGRGADYADIQQGA